VHGLIARIRGALERATGRAARNDGAGEACAWDALHATYREQAARGVPEAIAGLERIEQGRWPSSGRRR
jgi:hypothetical protein